MPQVLGLALRKLLTPYLLGLIIGSYFRVFIIHIGGVLMIQAKFSLKESHIQFLEQCTRHGFKDKSDVVRIAIDRLITELTQQRLRESAALYADVYEEDDETREWTDSALSEWPT